MGDGLAYKDTIDGCVSLCVCVIYLSVIGIMFPEVGRLRLFKSKSFRLTGQVFSPRML